MTPEDKNEAVRRSEPSVHVEATIHVELSLPLSCATEGWTNDERTALLNGDEEAREVVVSEQIKEAYETGFGWDVDFEEVRLDGGCE